LKLRNKVGHPYPTISFVCIRFERVFFENRDNGIPNGFALSLTLSHGEREQNWLKIQTWLGFSILNPLSHGERGKIGWKSKA